MQLSPAQIKIFDRIMSWLHEGDSQEFVLAGYAGTGKSTLAAEIAERVGAQSVYYCAYTGKAANVLREKGCWNTQTIHGWLYEVGEYSKKKLKSLQEELSEARSAGNAADIASLEKAVEKYIAKMKRPRFELNMESELKNAALVIVDEFSMLPDKILADLRKVARKILFIGDPYQLPPVEGECSLRPDAFLEEIHRQALDSSIIQYSKIVREGGVIPMGLHGDLDFIRKGDATTEMFLQADQVICGRNNTRITMNNWFRRQLGYSGAYPVRGEKLICLKNNHPAGLFNGMICRADAHASYSGLFCWLDIEGRYAALRVFEPDFNGGIEYDYRNPIHRELERFTFAHVITCHKSQGSEFDTLAVINEPIGRGEERRRWLYTALTRAKKKCTLIDSK